MNLSLSEHVTYPKLLRFTLPSMGMLLFTSIYSVVDGFFVSNYVGKTPFAALNIIFPFVMILGSLGFMLGTGGSALVAKTLGEGNPKRANSIFSMLVYVGLGLSALLAAVGLPLLPKISVMLGADSSMIDYCVEYGAILLIALPAFMLQNMFQALLVTAGKPELGLKVTVAAGVTNAVLDWLFMAVFEWGLTGAALATAIGQVVGGVLPLVYFAMPNGSNLRLGSARLDLRALARVSLNGSSELVTNVSMSFVTILYNLQLMRFLGEDGVAAYGVVMYINFFFIALFLGYSMGVSPVVSYHYGAGNRSELHNLFRKSLVILMTSAVAMVAAAELSAGWLSRLFVGYDEGLTQLTRHAFAIYSISFIFAPIGIFGSAFFTALNNGVISALLSFGRMFLFQAATILLLPRLMGVEGIWWAIVAAEALSVVLTLWLFSANRHRYGY
ncbi:MAG: MATE family efflux transporter [Tidjanibacter sp.]|nr:MATE family efflux transporter [Tidjanibacter sp.]